MNRHFDCDFSICQAAWPTKLCKNRKSATRKASSTNLQVADFGGTLGLFIGFSFITIWDGFLSIAVAGAKLKAILLKFRMDDELHVKF